MILLCLRTDLAINPIHPLPQVVLLEKARITKDLIICIGALLLAKGRHDIYEVQIIWILCVLFWLISVALSSSSLIYSSLLYLLLITSSVFLSLMLYFSPLDFKLRVFKISFTSVVYMSILCLFLKHMEHTIFLLISLSANSTVCHIWVLLYWIYGWYFTCLAIFY